MLFTNESQPPSNQNALFDLNITTSTNPITSNSIQSNSNLPNASNQNLEFTFEEAPPGVEIPAFEFNFDNANFPQDQQVQSQIPQTDNQLNSSNENSVQFNTFYQPQDDPMHQKLFRPDSNIQTSQSYDQIKSQLNLHGKSDSDFINWFANDHNHNENALNETYNNQTKSLPDFELPFVDPIQLSCGGFNSPSKEKIFKYLSSEKADSLLFDDNKNDFQPESTSNKNDQNTDFVTQSNEFEISQPNKTTIENNDLNITQKPFNDESKSASNNLTEFDFSTNTDNFTDLSKSQSGISNENNLKSYDFSLNNEKEFVQNDSNEEINSMPSFEPKFDGFLSSENKNDQFFQFEPNHQNDLNDSNQQSNSNINRNSSVNSKNDDFFQFKPTNTTLESTNKEENSNNQSVTSSKENNSIENKNDDFFQFEIGNTNASSEIKNDDFFQFEPNSHNDLFNSNNQSTSKSNDNSSINDNNDDFFQFEPNKTNNDSMINENTSSENKNDDFSQFEPTNTTLESTNKDENGNNQSLLLSKENNSIDNNNSEFYQFDVNKENQQFVSNNKENDNQLFTMTNDHSTENKIESTNLNNQPFDISSNNDINNSIDNKIDSQISVQSQNEFNPSFDNNDFNQFTTGNENQNNNLFNFDNQEKQEKLTSLSDQNNLSDSNQNQPINFNEEASTQSNEFDFFTFSQDQNSHQEIESNDQSSFDFTSSTNTESFDALSNDKVINNNENSDDNTKENQFLFDFETSNDNKSTANEINENAEINNKEFEFNFDQVEKPTVEIQEDLQINENPSSVEINEKPKSDLDAFDNSENSRENNLLFDGMSNDSIQINSQASFELYNFFMNSQIETNFDQQSNSDKITDDQNKLDDTTNITQTQNNNSNEINELNITSNQLNQNASHDIVFDSKSESKETTNDGFTKSNDDFDFNQFPPFDTTELNNQTKIANDQSNLLYEFNHNPQQIENSSNKALEFNDFFITTSNSPQNENCNSNQSDIIKDTDNLNETKQTQIDIALNEKVDQQTSDDLIKNEQLNSKELSNSRTEFITPQVKKKRFFEEFEQRFKSPLPKPRTPRKSFINEYNDLFPELKQQKKTEIKQPNTTNVNQFFKEIKEKVEAVEKEHELKKKQILDANSSFKVNSIDKETDVQVKENDHNSIVSNSNDQKVNSNNDFFFDFSSNNSTTTEPNSTNLDSNISHIKTENDQSIISNFDLDLFDNKKNDNDSTFDPVFENSFESKGKSNQKMEFQFFEPNFNETQYDSNQSFEPNFNDTKGNSFEPNFETFQPTFTSDDPFQFSQEEQSQKSSTSSNKNDDQTKQTKSLQAPPQFEFNPSFEPFNSSNQNQAGSSIYDGQVKLNIDISYHSLVQLINNEKFIQKDGLFEDVFADNDDSPQDALNFLCGF